MPGNSSPGVRALRGGLAWGVAAVVLGALATGSAAAPLAGGGFTLWVQQLSVPQLAQELKEAGYGELPTSILLYGGGGQGPVGRSAVGGGFTTGGFGAGGGAQVTSGQAWAQLALGFGGVRFGFDAPITESVSIDGGLGVAFGAASLTVVPDRGACKDFALSSPCERTYARFLLALVPDLSLSLSLSRFLHAQVGVGYFFDTGLGAGRWTTVTGDDVQGGPADSLSGLQYRLTLVFGVRALRPARWPAAW